MILINFAHPLTPEQLTQINSLMCTKVERVIEVDSTIDPMLSLSEQIISMVDKIPLTPREWQSQRLLINLPSLNYSAAALMAELHGRMGYFPACIRMRLVPGTTPPEFEVAEILNLQEIRNGARERRLTK